MLAAAHAPSYSVGELLLRKLGGINLTGRGLNKTAVKIGSEMVAQRDALTEAYFNQPLPRQHHRLRPARCPRRRAAGENAFDTTLAPAAGDCAKMGHMP